MAFHPHELAKSLTQEEIPIKLRCASCNKLAVNAFRLPCCDQNICESCQQQLPESCPVCMHSPLSRDDCNPNKALRLTVKAFLKNEQKKRDFIEAESKANTEQSTAAVNREINGGGIGDFMNRVEDKLDYAAYPDGKSPGSPNFVTHPPPRINPIEAAANVQQNQESITAEDQILSARPLYTEDKGDDLKEEAQKPEEYESETKTQTPNQDHSQNNPGLQAWSNTNGSFPPMGVNLNPTNQLWFNPAGFGGMPSAGFDPMAMANMYSSYYGQGVMGMYGGMGIEMGYGGFGGGWSQQSMMNGMDSNFGMNSGYHTIGGYNHHLQRPNFNQMQQQNLNLGSYGPRRHPGQGVSHQRQPGANQAYSAGEIAEIANGASNDTVKAGQDPQKTASSTIAISLASERALSGNVIQDAHEIKDGKVSESGKQAETAASENQAEESSTDGATESTVKLQLESHMPNDELVSTSVMSQTASTQAMSSDLITAEAYSYQLPDSVSTAAERTNFQPIPSIPVGPASQVSRASPFRGGRGAGIYRHRSSLDARGFGRERSSGDIQALVSDGKGFPPTSQPGPGVAGAPTGPKAMRLGQPRPGFRGRDHGHVNSRPSSTSQGTSEYQQNSKTNSEDPDKSIQSERNRHSESGDHSRPPHRDGKRQRRSNSISEEEHRSQYRSSRRGSHGRTEAKGDEDDASPSRHSSQTRSPGRSLRRTSDRGKERKRDRRHRRDVSRSGAEEARQQRSNSRSEAHRREDRPRDHRNSEKEKKHAQRQRNSQVERPDSGELKIKDRSKQQGDEDHQFELRKKPAATDPHTLEREARNRERLLKEQQRRYSILNDNKKRAVADEADDGKLHRSGRRKLHSCKSDERGRFVNFHYEDDENDEARALRIETEREAERWQ